MESQKNPTRFFLSGLEELFEIKTVLHHFEPSDNTPSDPSENVPYTMEHSKDCWLKKYWRSFWESTLRCDTQRKPSDHDNLLSHEST
ncbi:hypothetical protein FUAX_44100 (plasmid) [Fulvitalea axinellae]|uniref:Uncharacterized protein n=1 Tax=Fulvitalea axinellae TaxID=1182444 RepID=A0AAU9D7J1_9BACT|nr:hypothetical protein FUAX_44100 [Fulvitalea axinellae]